MTSIPEARWLDQDENRTWHAVWKLMTWLPARLDAQLRADAGLSLADYNALAEISAAPDHTVRLSELAASTNMTLSHLSRVMSRLETLGWVVRYPDPTDGRSTLAHLTDGGWAKVVATAPGHVEAVRRYLFDNLSAEESRALGAAAAVVASAAAPTGSARE
ncbi:MarR family transcriptional regulator [Cryobacterium frigoriphilum]|uniref:MarR family transcriptional regulator n=1 Tax=Cryobacterium frigoriphilum TaxID=1259150 RepID=A0A4R8ZUU4_9MICO|nr:MarR family winged helix-turn-helix transcriptional regulator [Cryobacterium frigoriphilum]TFD46937.1 MarR family transcriptional regulator [Cryobacterium frigoriphilum]